MKLYIMRHGETDGNRGNRLQGRADIPLNENGIRQAKEAGEKLSKKNLIFDAVYSSPLQRAMDTAVLVSGRRREELRTDERLLEIDLGPYDGADLKQSFPVIRQLMENRPPEGVEKISSLEARISDFVRDLTSSPCEQNMLIVTHGVAMRGIIRELTGRENVWGINIGNCEIYEADIGSHGCRSCRSFQRLEDVEF